MSLASVGFPSCSSFVPSASALRDALAPVPCLVRARLFAEDPLRQLRDLGLRLAVELLGHLLGLGQVGQRLVEAPRLVLLGGLRRGNFATSCA